MTSAEPGSDNTSVRRRRFRFRFTARRGLAILIVPMLIFFFGLPALRYWQHSRFCAEVEGLGGQIMLDDHARGWQTDRRGDPRAATNVYLRGCDVDDRWLVQYRSALARLPGRLFVDLTKSRVGDDAIHALTGLRVHGLGLSSTQVTDEGVRQLVKIESLEHLDLQDVDVTDAAIAELKRHPRLRSLNLGGPRISDNTIAALAKLAGLKYVYLKDAQITDRGVAELEKLSGLKQLYLTNTPITDRGMASLRKALPTCRITVD